MTVSINSEMHYNQDLKEFLFEMVKPPKYYFMAYPNMNIWKKMKI